MSLQGSYQAETFAASLDAEIRRLNAQVDLFWRVERVMLDRAGLRDGMAILDCGCGPGRLIELLKRDKPGLKCMGLEIDPVLVEAARKKFSEGGLDHCEVVQGSAENPNLPAGSFDFITMRLVLEHLPDPVLALRQLGALLRPGGRIVVISNDFEFHLRTWPPVPELDPLYEAYCASRRKDRGDPCIGRRLPRLLREAGLNVAAFDLEVAHSALEGDRAFLQAEGAGIPAQLVQSGFLSEQVFQQMVGSWKKMLQHPDHSMMRPLFVAVGEKTDHEGTSTLSDTVARDALTANGTQPAAASLATSAADLDYVAPGTDLEKQIAAIWCKAMGLQKVGITSNFFDIGGDSLMLEEIQVQLGKLLGAELSIAVLFQYPRIQALAEHLASPAAPDGPTTSGDTGDLDEVQRQAQRRREAAARRRK